jgi:hypothetical protein
MNSILVFALIFAASVANAQEELFSDVSGGAEDAAAPAGDVAPGAVPYVIKVEHPKPVTENRVYRRAEQSIAGFGSTGGLRFGKHGEFAAGGGLGVGVSGGTRYLDADGMFIQAIGQAGVAILLPVGAIAGEVVIGRRTGTRTCTPTYAAGVAGSGGGGYNVHEDQGRTDASEREKVGIIGGGSITPSARLGVLCHVKGNSNYVSLSAVGGAPFSLGENRGIANFGVGGNVSVALGDVMGSLTVVPALVSTASDKKVDVNLLLGAQSEEENFYFGAQGTVVAPLKENSGHKTTGNAQVVVGVAL